MSPRVFFYIFILIALIVLFFFVGNRGPSSYTVEEPEPDVDWDWVEENCDCIERENFYCSFENFELGEGNLCWKGEEFTNPVRGCSKYNCTGEIYEVE